jgi:glycosyltransferase involved in cell wall biosynthesis
MKVLWFSNTPANGINFLSGKTYKGGWLQELDIAVQNEVELNVAFYNPNGLEKFKVNKTEYYSIRPKDWRKRLIMKSLFNRTIDRNDEKYYMQIVNQVKPDLIHIHGTESGFIRILPLVDCPVLVSMQGITTVIYHKFNLGLKDSLLRNVFLSKGLELSSFMPKSFFHHKKLMRDKAKLEYKYMPYIKHIAGRTYWDKNVCRVLSPKAKYYHIDRVLKDVFYETVWERPVHNEKIFLHSTTSNSTFKGFETICEALFELNKIHDNITWNIAGIDNDSPIVKIVKDSLGKRFPVKGLNLMGKLTADKLVEQMKKAHLFVMASHIENSPNNLAEAMILGMPCIATLAGGTGTYLQNKNNGLLIQDGDPWVMAGSILELLNNYDEAINYGKRGRHAALKRHQKINIVKQLLSTYNEIVFNND